MTFVNSTISLRVVVSVLKPHILTFYLINDIENLQKLFSFFNLFSLTEHCFYKLYDGKRFKSKWEKDE